MNTGNETLGTLLLCRHGETEWNRSGRIMGQGDSPMTVEGLARIRVLADLIAQQGVDRIVASPLGRAALTGCMYSERLSAPVHFDALIAELSAGAWQGELRMQGTVHGRPFRAGWDD
ncbi:MAG: histidine phosphatase family protein, partial [Desulfomonilaceae bacterium]